MQIVMVWTLSLLSQQLFASLSPGEIWVILVWISRYWMTRSQLPKPFFHELQLLEVLH